jgi:hypothetical protein
MLTAIIIFGVTIVGIGSASLFHRHRQLVFLNKALNVDESFTKQAANELGIDGSAIAAVTTFDVLYNSMKLSPEALTGIDHLHHSQDFQSLSDLMDYMKDEIIKSESGEIAWRQMVHKYKGYTGEETAFGKLAEDGHSIQIPESGTTEGLDVIVDGKAYNVKVTDNPSYIQEHLDKYPDVDVIANKEMAQAFGDHPRVKIDPDLSSQQAFHDTGDTMEGLNDMGDFLDGIPVLTLIINTARNGKRIYDGKVDFKTATEHTVIDTVGVGAGGWAGSEAGLALGLALASATGGTSAIVIPVVTSVIGALIGVFTGKGISGWFKGRYLRKAVEVLKDLSISFRNKFLNLYDQLVLVSNNYYNELLQIVDERKNNGGSLKRILFPNTSTTFYKMADSKLRDEKLKAIQFYKDLKKTIQNAEKSEGGMILYAQGLNILNDVDPLPELYQNMERQLNIVQAEKRKLA